MAISAMTLRTSLAVAVLALLSACGGGSTTTSSSSPAAASPTASKSVDACVVGTWTSTGDSGTTTMPDGVSVTMSGGAGVVDTVGADGTVHDDYSNAQPEVGTAADGTVYDITTTGTLDAGLAAANGNFTLDPVNPQSASQTIKRPSDGTSFGPYHPPSHETGTYQCSAGSSLAVTANGVTVTYKPAQ